MVQVRAQKPINSDGSVNIDAWLEHIATHDPAVHREGMHNACDFVRDADQHAQEVQNLCVENSSLFRTGLDIAVILADLNPDQESLVAAVIYRAVRAGKATLEQVTERFGTEVAKLIEGVLRMAAISASVNPRDTTVFNSQVQVENLRKMLVAMVDDVR